MAESTDRVVVVGGEGTGIGSPDRCDLFLAVQGRGPGPGQAVAAVTASADAVLAALKGAGVPEAYLQTTNLSVQEWLQHGRPEPEGFVAHYALTVTDRPVGTAGELLSIAAAASGEALRVNGTRLRFSDPDPLRREARRSAVDDARQRAEDLVAAAGVLLGPILRIEDVGGSFPGQPARRVAFAAAASVPPVPVEPGLGGISATVIVTFAIEG